MLTILNYTFYIFCNQFHSYTCYTNAENVIDHTNNIEVLIYHIHWRQGLFQKIRKILRTEVMWASISDTKLITDKFLTEKKKNTSSTFHYKDKHFFTPSLDIDDSL